MALVQHMWYHSTLPTELSWTILVLTPKGNADTREMGILEVLWNVVKAIIDTLIKMAVIFHEVLHGFCAFIVTGTAIMELNMGQYLSGIEQDPLFLVSYTLWFSSSISLVTWLVIFYELML